MDRKIVEVELLHFDCTSDLLIDMRSMVLDDWHILGPTQPYYDNDSECVFFMQTMVKYEEIV